MTIVETGDRLPQPAALWSTLAGLCFFLAAAQFMTVLMATASMAPGYDLNAGAISDLGVIPATAPWFNASLMLTGILTLCGAVARFAAERSVLQLILSALAAAGAVGAGIVPLDQGGLHGLFALFAFLFYNIHILPAALRDRGALRLLGLALAAWGFAYVVVMFIGDAGNAAVFGPIGHGGAERMIVYPPMLWLMVMGGALMASSPRPAAGGARA